MSLIEVAEFRARTVKVALLMQYDPFKIKELIILAIMSGYTLDSEIASVLHIEFAYLI